MNKKKYLYDDEKDRLKFPPNTETPSATIYVKCITVCEFLRVIDVIFNVRGMRLFFNPPSQKERTHNTSRISRVKFCDLKSLYHNFSTKCHGEVNRVNQKIIH